MMSPQQYEECLKDIGCFRRMVELVEAHGAERESR
jgi:hypothetical protein